MITIKRPLRPWFVLYIGCILTIICFIPELINWEYISLGDWGYFNALSLFTRSCILNYKTLLMYDPWVLGGFDVYTNPENRTFSPLVLLDILLPPQLANIISIMLFTIAGFVGCYYLFKHFHVSFTVSMVCATLFLNSQWFALHFAEGHIRFAPFLLLPWILLAIMRIYERKFIFIYAFLCTFFILNGSFYVFIFSIVLLFSAFLFGLVPIKKIFNLPFWKHNGLLIVLLVIAFLMITAIKILPIMKNNIYAQAEKTTIYVQELGKIFFNYLGLPQELFKKDISYQEFGCFIGFLTLGIVVIYLVLKKKHFKKSARFLFLCLFFLWISTNWGGIFNPWTIISAMPLVNVAHIQSRYLILMYLFLIIILAFALQKLKMKKKPLFYAAALILVLESFFVRMYAPYTMTARAFKEMEPFKKTLIVQRSLAYTGHDTDIYARKPFHYFTGNGAKYTYETISHPSAVVNIEDTENYKGEIYFKSPGVSGTASYGEVSPGKILFSYEIAATAELPAVIELNLNWSEGFKIISGDNCKAFPSADGLINVEVNRPAGSVFLRYAPGYLVPALLLYVAGILIWIGLLLFFYFKDIKKRVLSKKLVLNGAP